MSLFKSVKVINSGKAILLSRKKGTPLRYHSTWLRDNALDSKTRDKKNGQRLISISDIPVKTYIKSCLLYTSPSPRDGLLSRMPSSA